MSGSWVAMVPTYAAWMTIDTRDRGPTVDPNGLRCKSNTSDRVMFVGSLSLERKVSQLLVGSHQLCCGEPRRGPENMKMEDGSAFVLER